MRKRRALAELAEGFGAAAVLDRLGRKGFRAVTYADEAYPARLRLAPDLPPALFVGGEMGEGLSVAVVGSHRATRADLETAEVLGRALATRGACVVSGLAAGVDAAAHEGALAAGGRTIGVLGCGIDVVYPRENRELFGRVREGGALASEYALGESAARLEVSGQEQDHRGPLGRRSGSRGVGEERGPDHGPPRRRRRACSLGGAQTPRRPRVPGLEQAPRRRCRRSLGRQRVQGAVCGPGSAPGRAAVEEIGATPVFPDPPDGLPEHEAEVLRGVDFKSAGADVVAGRTGVEMRTVLSSLAMLELKGYVARDAAGNFSRGAAP